MENEAAALELVYRVIVGHLKSLPQEGGQATIILVKRLYMDTEQICLARCWHHPNMTLTLGTEVSSTKLLVTSSGFARLFI